jgi:oligoendopeptidase F
VAKYLGYYYFANKYTFAMPDAIEIPQRPQRKFLPEQFEIGTWETLKPYFEDLLSRPIENSKALRHWLDDRSELESVISEDVGWRYIKMTCYTDNELYSKRYQDFVENIQPHMAPFSDQLNRRLAASPFLQTLELEPGFSILIRNVKKDIELFREANIPLFTKINTETQKYGQLSGAMTVNIDGKELTLQQASVILQSTDRTKREQAYRKVAERRSMDSVVLDELFSSLISLRHQVALNADMKNFRDYMLSLTADLIIHPRIVSIFMNP